MRLLRYSEFESSDAGHGGCRRSAQIDDVLSRYGIEFFHLEKLGAVRPNVFKMCKYALGGGIEGVKWNKSSLLSLRGLFYTGLYKSNLADPIKQNRSGSGLLWEPAANGGCLLVGKIAQSMGCKIVALPHNLESLVPTQRSPITQRKSPEWFLEELDYLRCADKIFCISREEQWLLRAYGIDALYFPYFPSEGSMTRLKRIRSARQGALKDIFLILGTAYNPATRLGLIEQISLLSGVRLPENSSIVIAGYGTESVLNKSLSANLKLLGTVSESMLFDLLVRARAVLIHQVPTSGILTRIIEMQIVGVPVIANIDAARSFHEREGVYLYESPNEIVDLIFSDLKCPPIPSRNGKEESRFISEVKNVFE